MPQIIQITELMYNVPKRKRAAAPVAIAYLTPQEMQTYHQVEYFKKEGTCKHYLRALLEVPPGSGVLYPMHNPNTVQHHRSLHAAADAMGLKIHTERYRLNYILITLVQT